MSLARAAAAAAAASRRRPARAAAALYAALALLMVAPGLLPGRTLSASDYLWTAAPWNASAPDGVGRGGANYELADSVAAFQPFLQYARRRLPAVPLWNPHVMGGRPFVANAQSAVFSPFSVPAYVLPFWWSLGVIAALKLFCAAFGTYLLARALGQRPAGALLAGLAFGFSLYFVTWLSWPLTSVWAFLPWLLLLVDRVVRRPDAPGVAGLACVMALQFSGGHPESSFHVGVAAVLFAALRLSRAAGPDGPRALLAPAGGVVAGLASGGALAAVALGPFLELLARSGDLADRAGREAGHLPPKYVLGLALPEYWGRPTRVLTEPFLHARAFYTGTLPLVLAALALLRPGRERVAIAGAGAAALGVVLGVPPVFELVTALPGFAQAVNMRLAVVTVLAIALLAGWGLDDLLARRLEGRAGRLVPAVLAGVLAVPLAVVVLRAPVEAGLVGRAAAFAIGLAGVTGDDRFAVVPMAAALTWAALGGAGVVLAWLGARGRIGARVLAPLALALTAADLFRFGLGQNPSIPLDHARQPATGAIRHLQARRPARFAGVAPERGIAPLPADLAMRYGLQDARGYDYPVERRYDRLWRRAIAPRVPFVPPTTLAGSSDGALRALGLLGVADLLQQPSDRPLRAPGARRVYDGPDARVYGNPHALPRAWVVERQRVVATGDAALDAVLSAGFDARATAVVERPVGRLPRQGAPGGRPGSAPAGTARIVRHEPERVVLSVTARAPSLAILSDVWYPGWRATVDGRQTSVERVDYLLRGVRVGPGSHRIELTYRPASWRVSWMVTVVTAAVLAAAVLRSRRRPHRGAA